MAWGEGRWPKEWTRPDVDLRPLRQPQGETRRTMRSGSMKTITYAKARQFWTTEARDLGEFLSVVKDTKQRWYDYWKEERIDPWFRGVSDENYPLLPGAYRPAVLEADYVEDNLRDEFVVRAWPYLSAAADPPQNDWEWYLLMQHYGMFTRLLDWTEAGGVGLYFALRTPRPADPAIWMLDPFWLNQKIAGWKDAILDISYSYLKRYLHEPFASKALPIKPVAFVPPFKSKRIAAQKGMFTIHGRSKRALEAYPFGNHLVKVVTRRSRVAAMKDELISVGITETSVFPELEGLSREVVGYWTPFEPTERIKVAKDERRQSARGSSVKGRGATRR
jgi:hypothetical protein